MKRAGTRNIFIFLLGLKRAKIDGGRILDMSRKVDGKIVL